MIFQILLLKKVYFGEANPFRIKDILMEASFKN